MIKFNILISETARKQLFSLEKDDMIRIRSSLNELRENPFLNRAKADIRKLKGFKNPELYRLRVGNFRIIYIISENNVKVTEIILRSKGYDWLE